MIQLEPVSSSPQPLQGLERKKADLPLKRILAMIDTMHLHSGPLK